MNIKLKLSVLLLTMLAFIIISCGQKGADHDNADHSHAEGHDNADHHEGGGTDSESATAYASLNEEEAANLLNAYLELKTALVKSSADMAQNAAEEITKILDGKNTSVLAGIEEDANHILETNEMEQMREHFEVISQNVYDMVKAKNTGKTIYKQYCPMAFNNEGAFWLSSEEEIRNPYFGDKMLKCGNVEETISGK